MRFATRLNSFAANPEAFWPGKSGKPTMLDMAQRAATVEGLTDLDLNFPGPSRGNPGDRGAAHRRPRPDDQRLRHALLHQSGLQARRLHESGPGREARGDRSDQEGHRRDPRGRQQPDDALARPGRLRLRLPGGLRRGVVDGGRRHPRGRRARPRLHDQHRVQAERAARLQPARHLRLDPARDPGGRLPRTSASPSISRTSSMPTSSPPSRRRSRIATAGFSASTSTTATPSATTG